MIRVDGEVRRWVDDVLAQAIAGFHQGVQVLTRRMHGDPARVIARVRCVEGADEFDRAIGVFAVCPQLVGRQIGAVEVGLGRVKDHAVNARVGQVRIILRVLVQRPRLIDGKHIAVAGVLVKRVGIHGVGGLFGGEEEDGAGVGGGLLGFGVAADGVGGFVNDFCWGFDGKTGPFLHGGAVQVLFGVLFFWKMD